MKPCVHCQELFEIVAVDIWKHNFSISWDLSVSFQRLVCSLSCIQHRRQHYILYGSLKIANHFLMYFCLKFITHDEKSSILRSLKNTMAWRHHDISWQNTIDPLQIIIAMTERVLKKLSLWQWMFKVSKFNCNKLLTCDLSTIDWTNSWCTFALNS